MHSKSIYTSNRHLIEFFVDYFNKEGGSAHRISDANFLHTVGLAAEHKDFSLTADIDLEELGIFLWIESADKHRRVSVEKNPGNEKMYRLYYSSPTGKQYGFEDLRYFQDAVDFLNGE